jgi:hypothetical protein
MGFSAVHCGDGTRAVQTGRIWRSARYDLRMGAPSRINPPFPVWRLLRLVAAGLFVFACIIGSVALASRFFPDPPEWLLVPMALAATFGSILLAMWLFRGKRLPRRTREEIQAERQAWDDAGLLSHESFHARRAFEVDEFEDEGAHFFVELEDGSVLYLSGQFLYEYEPIDTRKIQRPRTFPCTQFTIRRFKQDNAIIDILCSGEVLEPEVTTPPFFEEDLRKDGWIAEETILIRDKAYDQLKAGRLADTRNRR